MVGEASHSEVNDKTCSFPIKETQNTAQPLWSKSKVFSTKNSLATDMDYESINVESSFNGVHRNLPKNILNHSNNDP